MSGMFSFDLALFTNFSPVARCVNWLYRSEQCDILLVCWEPGQASSYHDHVRSESVVYVMQGRVTVVSEKGEQSHQAGEVVVTPQGAKHQLRNDTQERLVTLHVYTPRLETPISEPVNNYTHLENTLGAISL